MAEDRILVTDEGKTDLLRLYHDSPHSGGYDGIWRAYRKAAKRFTWPHMQKDIESYVKFCDVCQRCKAKFRKKLDAMLILPVVAPLHTIHLDFADELGKKRDGLARTKSFLVAIDRNTRSACYLRRVPKE